MPDIDRLIEAWEIFRDSNPYELCKGREFRAISEPEYCMGQMIEDTLALLKEHDAVAPLTIDDAVSEIMDKHYERLKEKEAVVRCKDCEYYKDGFCYNPNTFDDEKTRGNTVPDWYCADGKRR